MSESTMTVQAGGTKRWYNKACELHREDGPAIEWSNGTKSWFQRGKLHRVDGPAIESYQKNVGWFYDGFFLGNNLEGFWVLWELLNDKERQNVNLHMWLRKLTKH